MPRRKNKRAHVQSPCFRIRRGDIYLADLGTKADVIGSEQFGVRPVLITQCNRQNDRSTTYIIVIITSEIKKTRMDTHVILPMVKGLSRQSMACCEQRFTIGRLRLLEYRGHLDNKTMKRITRACRLAEAQDRDKLPRFYRGRRHFSYGKAGNYSGKIRKVNSAKHGTRMLGKSESRGLN